MKKEILHSINVVANQTGLSQFVIRAWENRYGAVEPKRTDSNRRVYSEADVYKLKLLKQLTDYGYSIGNIANLEIEKLEDLIKDDKSKLSEKEEFKINYDLIDDCLDAIKDYNQQKLLNILQKASIEFNNSELVNTIIVPLITKIGDNWHQGRLKIWQEHLATSTIQYFLKNLIEIFSHQTDAPKIIIATPKGQQHELGALLTALIAVSEGWEVIYLGVNLPMEEVTDSTLISKVNVIALSLVYPAYDFVVLNELLKLRDLSEKKIKIFLGGKSAHSYSDAAKEIDAIILDNLQEFRIELKKTAENIEKSNN